MQIEALAKEQESQIVQTAVSTDVDMQHPLSHDDDDLDDEWHGFEFAADDESSQQPVSASTAAPAVQASAQSVHMPLPYEIAVPSSSQPSASGVPIEQPDPQAAAAQCVLIADVALILMKLFAENPTPWQLLTRTTTCAWSCAH